LAHLVIILSKRRDSGFTLIELLVVLVIVAVTLGVLSGRGSMRSYRLEIRAAAGLLANSLRSARAQAIAEDHNISVAIDPARHGFAVDGGPMHIIDSSIDITVLQTALNGPGAAKLIRFSADGSSSGGGVLLGSGHCQIGVSVEWLSGQVEVLDAH